MKSSSRYVLLIKKVKVSSDLDSQKEIVEESLKTYPAYKARPEFL